MWLWFVGLWCAGMWFLGLWGVVLSARKCVQGVSTGGMNFVDNVFLFFRLKLNANF